MRKPLILIAALATTTLALAQAPMANGEVTKLDKANARITLKHGEIKAVGDRVRFTAERIDGNYTVTALSKAP